MELEIGMYCRFINFQGKIKIAKIKEIQEADDVFQYDYIKFDDGEGELKPNIIKTSHNIIDLIEVGDYVNGMEVTRISGTRYDDNDLHCYCEHNGNEKWKQVMIPAKDIKSIVTKEQFESIKYSLEG